MKSVQQLREDRAGIAQKMSALVEKEGDWTAEMQTEFDGFSAQIEQIDQQIKNQERIVNVTAMNAAKAARERADANGISEDEANAQIEQERGIFNTWMRQGANALTQEQHQFVLNRARKMRNELNTGTGSEGGFLVPQILSDQLVQALKSFGGMRQAATVIQTSSGQAIDYPTTDATSEEGEIVGENVQVASDEQPTFGTVSLATYKFSSKVIPVPFELLQDSAVDIEAHLVERLQQRLGRGTHRKFTVGSGTNEPRGIVTASQVGKVGAAGQTGTILYDDMLDLKHSVDPAYRESSSSGYMMHDSTVLALKKLKDNDGRPLWMPSLVAGEPDRFDGERYWVNQHMAEMSASAKSVLYGDFSRYMIRDVMMFMLLRMTDSKYAEKGQVGFLAFMRSGGNLIDVGGAVKHYQNAAV